MVFKRYGSFTRFASIFLSSWLVVSASIAYGAEENPAEADTEQNSNPTALAISNILKAGAPGELQKDDSSQQEKEAKQSKPVFADPFEIAQAPSPPTLVKAPLSATVTSDPQQALSRVDELTRQILLKEIELEKFNLHYRQEVAKQGRWKGWRYAFFQGGVNAGMALTGGIIGTAERGSHLRSPEHVHNAMQENANFIPMIGAIIGASSAVMEAGINEMHEIQAHKKGFAPKVATQHVEALRSDIDRLIQERDALISIERQAPTLTGHADIDVVEGKVLHDICDQSVLEYERYHVGARRLLAFQQTQYFFDFAKNVTNALGYEFAFLALHRHDRKWNLQAGVLFTVAGALTMGGPIVSRAAGALAARVNKHLTRSTIKGLEDNQCAVLQADQEALAKACAQNDCPPDSLAAPVSRGEIYSRQSKVFQDELAASSKEQNKAKLVATQNIGSGLYVGGSKVASGILFIVPGFYHVYNSKTKRAATVTNSDLFTAGVIGLQSSAFSMADTLRIQVQGEINRHKLAKQGRLPGQLIAAHLKELDDMEKRVQSTNVR